MTQLVLTMHSISKLHIQTYVYCHFSPQRIWGGGAMTAKSTSVCNVDLSYLRTPGSNCRPNSCYLHFSKHIFIIYSSEGDTTVICPICLSYGPLWIMPTESSIFGQNDTKGFLGFSIGTLHLWERC